MINDYKRDSNYKASYVGMSTSSISSQISQLRKQISLLQRDTSSANRATIKSLENQVKALQDKMYDITYSNTVYERICDYQDTISDLKYQWEAALDKLKTTLAAAGITL